MVPSPSWSRGFWPSVALAVTMVAGPLRAEDAKAPGKGGDGPVSFARQIQPIFRAQCQGCHQPAKEEGEYRMTTHAGLMAAGESGIPGVVPGKPDESHLIDQIAIDADGKALMPSGKPPLAQADIDLIRRWVAEGAKDDSPASTEAVYDRAHPPIYARPPALAAIAYAPDGSRLAVGGFHEVLLFDGDGSTLIDRLIGLSERIASVRFSPDGKKLAVAGGQPGRIGEIQVWDVATRELDLSLPVTHDTVYGATWSPDGKTIAFGCGDNSVRAIDAKTGNQVLFMGSHNDWALDTAFTKDGANLISVGRDMTAKLTEVATQRFVDNLTSITPGALKGGLAAVVRHPERDEIVIGGSDGEPKVYRVFRQTVRVIGDDSNLIRRLPPLAGRIFGVAVSADGTKIAAGSSLDGAGEVGVYAYNFDGTLPDPIKAIMAKVITGRTAEEKAALDAYLTRDVKALGKATVKAGVYGVAFRPDGKLVAAACGDGLVRLIDPETGAVAREFAPAPAGGTPAERPAPTVAATPPPTPTAATSAEPEPSPGDAPVASLDVQPTAIDLRDPYAYAQLVITARTADGTEFDATRLATRTAPESLVALTRGGLVRPRADGSGTLALAYGGKTVEVPVRVSGFGVARKVDYLHDVIPVLSRLGCNAGTCHGSAQGKNGFKMSLRGYDPIFDIRALTDDHASRRVNTAAPDSSLMLLKPTGAVPHVGGALMTPGEPYYEALRAWINDGAKLDLGVPRVKSIAVHPANPTVQAIGARQQLRVLATYGDGEVRDVTREAFLESGNTEVATADRDAVMTALRRGEAPILVRYEGAYAASTLTVMGDRTGFAWEDQPGTTKIDELTAAKWRKLKILPSQPCTDAEFLRRASLDLTGLPPTSAEVNAFLADARPSQVKRDELVDRLVGSPAYVDFWTNKWADLLQVNRKFLGVEGATAFRGWIRDQVDRNVPYDQFARSILTAEGSNQKNPAASYFKVLRDADATMENTTQLFLAIRFNCNKCHDHPFERWTQDQYYETAAYFAQVGLKADPGSMGKTIGGSAVEGAKPLFEEVYDKGDGEMIHDRTKKVAPPKFPFPSPHPAPEKASRRQELAAWITSPENPYFARSYVNRLWGYLFGVGVIEPIDDIRAGNPATNPELLDYLTAEFLKSNFDVRHVIKLIAKSRTYGLSVETNKWNADDRTNYSHAIARRLPAEVLLDAVYRVTGSSSKFPGVPAGTRAAALPDSGVELPSGFLNTFGRPPRESACECERTSGLQLGPVMALVSGPTLGDALSDPDNDLTRMVKAMPEDKPLISELFLRILNRPATPAEVAACLEDLGGIDEDHAKLAAKLGHAEAAYAMKRPALEREREAARAAARDALAAYEKDLPAKTAAREAERLEKVAKREEAVKAYEKTLAQQVAEWEKKQSPVNRWRILTPKAVTSTAGAKFAILPDGSVLGSGPDAPGGIVFEADTDLGDIVGIRLEMLPDPSLPAQGPGRAPDGNFVLNRIDVAAAPLSDPKAFKPVALERPLADFSQGNFSIAGAIEPGNDPARGWAISPAYGIPHWAVFAAKEPAGAAGGTALKITLTHQYQGMSYMPGRFRISVTRGDREVALGVPEELRAVLAISPETRTPAQVEVLMAYHRGLSPEARKRQNQLDAARKPLPPDPMLATLKANVEAADRPLPVEPALAQLRQDVEQSIAQAAARRLTAAQDVAWALINSPAFLFNH
ncbi:DUF1549 domain-containing protein [Tundrisphaera sp. TA3]|uniref:DUF1549 domain-containing protein n=1 Tax=Tundrisphaera sp. TA3 TaxID=3435775 RepID=UPI003EB6FDC4